MDTKNTTNISGSKELKPLTESLDTASNRDVKEHKITPKYNDTLSQNNFQPNSYNSDLDEDKMDHLQTNKRELMSYSDQKLSIQDDDESGGGGGFAGEEDDENDERFIAKDNSGLQEANEQIAQEIISDLENYQEDLKGIRPNTNQNRSLSHEHGGLEVKIVTHDKGGESTSEDVWDDHSEDLAEVTEQEDDRLSDTSTSSLRQSFIGTKKRNKKRRGKKHDEIAEEMEEGGLSLLDARKDGKESHVDKLNSRRNSNSQGGGITLF